MFPQPLPCVVEDTVRPDTLGRVKANGGVLWRAELYLLNCQTALIPGQPAQIIGRRGTVLIVIPCHCLLWLQYLEAHSQWLQPEDIKMMSRYDKIRRLS